jgi:hypothetical protein
MQPMDSAIFAMMLPVLLGGASRECCSGAEG